MAEKVIAMAIAIVIVIFWGLQWLAYQRTQLGGITLSNGYLINEEMGMRHGETINSWELVRDVVTSSAKRKRGCFLVWEHFSHLQRKICVSIEKTMGNPSCSYSI